MESMGFGQGCSSVGSPLIINIPLQCERLIFEDAMCMWDWARCIQKVYVPFPEFWYEFKGSPKIMCIRE